METSYILYVEGQPQGYPIPPAGLRVGRGGDNDIMLADDRASRRHLLVWPQGGQLYLRDEGSTNGVWVNEQRIAGAQAWQPGDIIRIGQTRLQVVAQPVAAVGGVAMPAGHPAQSPMYSPPPAGEVVAANAQPPWNAPGDFQEQPLVEGNRSPMSKVGKILLVVGSVILVLIFVVIGILVLLGPQIGSVFSSITSGLAGP